jgi:signal transduction histidine kinase
MISLQLAAIFAQLQAPQLRAAGTAALAAMCGARQLLLLGKEPELGLPPALRAEPRWQRFLQRCQRSGNASASLPDPHDGADIRAFGLSGAGAQATLVFLGQAPDTAQCRAMVALLPLLGASLQAESLAAAVNRRQDEFLAMLAHELRNPLAPISMAAQILKIGPSNPARLQQTCQIIERQVSHMTCLLDDLLDVSRVTGGQVTLAFELHDMRQVVDHALEQARPLINARGHHLTIHLLEQPACVDGDGTRLVQIVSNLLNNAAKYTPPGGEIGVRLALRDDQVVLTVRDNGIGIEPDLLPHVFDLFIQGARSSDRTQGGLGLGLALVKSLAQRHGGTVRASSAGAGHGSAFEVTLPRAATGAEAGAARADGADAAAPLAILIVDDNADAARTLALFLQAHGHTVQVAFDATQALALARSDVPRVLLLDIGLPDMDGYALARHLRAIPLTRDCVYIALTGYGCPEDRERSRKAGFDHHLTKPVNALELMSLLGAVEPH